MHHRLRSCLMFVSSLVLVAPVWATEAGWRRMTVPAAIAGAKTTEVALFYPTQAPARAIGMGPFTTRVAIDAAPDAGVKGLIVLSHGTGGSELGHSSLAEAIARRGYLVASLRHPGDNWQDRSLFQDGPGGYFSERPRQISRVIDALLRDPDWKDRIARDARGPRVGALGHSAGGYSVLALAGGQPDLPRLAAHCREHRAEDPVFCSVGQVEGGAAARPAAPAAKAPLLDPRVRAVAALAPVGAVFSADSLARIKVPVALYEAGADRFLVPRFHSDWIARHLPGVERHPEPQALHFAFMDTPSMPIQTEDGDIGADSPGFDRKAFLQRLGRELPDFFDRALR
jgi:predicted dienelactone hydrolase